MKSSITPPTNTQKAYLLLVPTPRRKELNPIREIQVNLLDLPKGCAFLLPAVRNAWRFCAKEYPDEIGVGPTHHVLLL